MNQTVLLSTPLEHAATRHEGSDIGDVPIDSVCDWVRLFVIPQKTFNTRHTSYGLKHYAEKFFNSYITNTGIKIAMIRCGYVPKNKNELNWVFRISERSPCMAMNGKEVCNMYNHYFSHREENI